MKKICVALGQYELKIGVINLSKNLADELPEGIVKWKLGWWIHTHKYVIFCHHGYEYICLI